MIWLIFFLIFIQLVVVGWVDFKTQKISNNWFFVNIGASVLLHIFMQQYYPLTWEMLIFPVGIVVVGFFLYLAHVMGAGDSKYLASLFFVIPLELHLPFLEKIVVSTIFTGFSLLIFRFVKEGPKLKAYFMNSYWEGIKNTIKSRFSYAPVILVAWILLGLQLWK